MAIRDLIVTLELAPGAIVREQDLMARLGMSRTPVREALRSLADERLVEVYPRRGIFVAGVDVRDLAALSEVRVELAALIEEIEKVGSSPRERDLMKLDQRVHQEIYRLARNTFLEGVLSQHYTHALRIWFLALDRVTTLDQAILEHRLLLIAVRDSDADRAAAVMLQHVDGFEGAIRRSL
jgi:DNA-binding GntR family transcriptional regulator